MSCLGGRFCLELKNLFVESSLENCPTSRISRSKWGSSSNPGIMCIAFETNNGTWCLKIQGQGEDKTLVHWPNENEDGYDIVPLNPSPRAILSCLHKACLKTKLCYSKNRQYIFCFVGLPYERMVQWADNRDFDKQLNATEAVKFGRTPGVNCPLAHNTQLEDEPKKCVQRCDKRKRLTTVYKDDIDLLSDLELDRLPLSLWRCVYIQYNAFVPQRIFATYEDGSVFSITNKLQMLDGIINTDRDLDGAGLKIIEMARSSHPVCALFVINDNEQLHNLIVPGTYWKFWGDRWHNVSLSNIRYYYGEKIAFYFSYLQFYTMALVPAVCVGIIFFVLQIIERQVACNGIYLWIFFLIIWNLAVCKKWERRQGFLRSLWGMARYKDKAVPRPQFAGQKGFSQVSGLIEEFVESKSKKTKKQCVSYSTVFFWVALVCVVIVLLFIVKEEYSESTSYAVMVGILNAILISITNLIYVRVSGFLNDWENHRLESQYENNMIVKRIVFQIVNSYASLVFIGFIKPYFAYETSMSQEEINNDVLKELQIQLISLFTSLMIIQNTIEIFLAPLTNKFFAYFKDTTPPAFTSTDHELSLDEDNPSFYEVDLGEAFNHITMQELQEDAELQIKQPISASVRDNMSELIIQQGYATMFAIAFPLAPFLALCNTVVEFSVDIYKLKANQRPIPSAADSVGLWGQVLWFLAGISVITNWALFIFRTNKLKEIPGIDHRELKLICFFVGLGIIYALLFVVNLIFLSTSDDLKLHQQRTEEIEKFLILKGLKKARQTKNVTQGDSESQSEELKKDSEALIMERSKHIAGFGVQIKF